MKPKIYQVMGRDRHVLGREALLGRVEGRVRFVEDRQIQESISKGVHLNNFRYKSRFDNPESVHLRDKSRRFIPWGGGRDRHVLGGEALLERVEGLLRRVEDRQIHQPRVVPCPRKKIKSCT